MPNRKRTGRGVLLVLAGTSGAGKGTVGAQLRVADPDLHWSVSWTTRPRRSTEVADVDYHYVSREDFERLRDEGGFLEWFEVYGDLKGTPRQFVLDELEAGRDVMLEVDVQGALAVKAALPEALLVFVKAPSRDEQRRRLEARGSDRRVGGEHRTAPGRRSGGGTHRRDPIRRGGRQRGRGPGRGEDRWYPDQPPYCGPKPPRSLMAERRPSLMEPRIEQLMGKVDSKFTLVTLAAMRAREINDYYNQLGEGLGRIVPPQVTSVSRKPLSIALEEVAIGKIVYERIIPEEEGATEADGSADAAEATTSPPDITA